MKIQLTQFEFNPKLNKIVEVHSSNNSIQYGPNLEMTELGNHFRGKLFWKVFMIHKIFNGN